MNNEDDYYKLEINYNYDMVELLKDWKTMSCTHKFLNIKKKRLRKKLSKRECIKSVMKYTDMLFRVSPSKIKKIANLNMKGN